MAQPPPAPTDGAQQPAYPPPQGYYPYYYPPPQGYPQQQPPPQGYPGYPPPQGYPQQQPPPGYPPPPQGTQPQQPPPGYPYYPPPGYPYYPPQAGYPPPPQQGGVPQQPPPQQAGGVPPPPGPGSSNVQKQSTTGTGAGKVEEKVIKNIFQTTKFETVVEADGDYCFFKYPTRYIPNGERFTIGSMMYKGFTLFDHRIPALVEKIDYKGQKPAKDWDIYREQTIIASVSGEKKNMLVHDIPNDKDTFRNFYDGPPPHILRVQQCQSPKVASSSCFLELDDLETGENLTTTKLRDITDILPWPENQDVLLVGSENRPCLYDVRANKSNYGYHGVTGANCDLRLYASANKVLACAGGSAFVFDIRTQKKETEFATPASGIACFRGGAIYGNIVLLNWMSHIENSVILIYDLNNLKGTGPRYTENKRISDDRFSNYWGYGNGNFIVTPEGIYFTSQGLRKLSYVL